MSNISFLPIDRTTPGQSEPWIDGNGVVLHIAQSSKTGASPSVCLTSYTGHSCLTLCRDAVSVFYSLSRLS